ncbi:hypothetical protein [Mesoplasma florum]|uniref:hypothetical protein n=1 Tax=Mesoplasma florum TaxID=2151 RepID=UPI000D03B7C9|nr:hypothetical protein [Mesoplasma florum]AVN59044.1 hypothetical protein CG009_02315 [Mesoplasma florum]
MKKKIDLIVLSLIAVIPFFCVLIDLILSVVKAGKSAISFDESLMNQLIYFSVWTTLLTGFWGIASVISFFKKPSKKIAWAESDNVITMIVTYQILVFLVYSITFLVYRKDIAGFDTWYKILKSVLEHWLLPIGIIIYYFTKERKSNLSQIDYMKNKAWINCFIPMFYVLFVTTRGLLIMYYPNGETNNLPVFPYRQIDPINYPVYVWLPGIISFIAVPYLLSSLLNFGVLKVNEKNIIKWNTPANEKKVLNK